MPSALHAFMKYARSWQQQQQHEGRSRQAVEEHSVNTAAYEPKTSAAHTEQANTKNRVQLCYNLGYWNCLAWASIAEHALPLPCKMSNSTCLQL
jgi:hypothetical protein